MAMELDQLKILKQVLSIYGPSRVGIVLTSIPEYSVHISKNALLSSLLDTTRTHPKKKIKAPYRDAKVSADANDDPKEHRTTSSSSRVTTPPSILNDYL